MNYINYFTKEDYCISVPVLIYRALVVNKKQYKDFLGEKIVEIIKASGINSVEFICDTLGIPENYSKIVENEMKELANIGILDSITFLPTGVEVEKETAEVFLIYDLVKGQFLNQVIPESMLNRKITYNLNFSKRPYKLTQQVAYPKHYEVSSDIEKVINHYNDFVKKSSQEEEESTENSSEELEELVLYGQELQLIHVINPHYAVEAELLFKAVRSQEDDGVIFYMPFNGVPCTYVDKNLGDNINFKALRSEIIEWEYSSMVPMLEKPVEVQEMAAFTKESMSFFNKLKNLKGKGKLIKGYANICYNLSQLLNKEFSVGNEVLIINGMNDLVKMALTELNLRITAKSAVSVRGKTLDKYVSEEELTRFLDDRVWREFKRTSFKLEPNTSINDSTIKKSLTSYLLVSFIGHYICRDELCRRFITYLKANGNITSYVEEIRCYRNNTEHSLDKGSIYDEKYDLREKPLESKREELRSCRGWVEEILKAVNEVL